MRFIYSQDMTETNEAVKKRFPYAMRKYSSQGMHIPLRENWSHIWCTLPCHYLKIMDDVYNFKIRNDDVFVVTFMKSGTTWMQETAWLLMNNLDFIKAKEISVPARSPYLDVRGLFPERPLKIEHIDSMASPRLIKCHLPAQLLPQQIWEKKQKIIYMARNVKDVIVSSYHMTLKVGMWMGDNIVDYVEDFINNDIVFTSYWSHVLNFWKMRHEPFIFFVTYEEMQRDLLNVLQRLCIFLDRPQLTAEELEKIVKHLSFESMKDNKQTNLTDIVKSKLPNVKEDFQFMRRGIIGSYKDELTPELQEKINKWSQDILQQHGVTEEEIFGQL